MAINITVVSYKGGVGKTTTAIHLAAYIKLILDKPVMLVDGDLNQSALDWYNAANGTDNQLPCSVVTVEDYNNVMTTPKEKAMWGRLYDYFVWDTPARPTPEELMDLVESDYFLVPTTPDALALRATFKMIQDLKKIQKTQGKKPITIILTKVPPKPSTVGDEARATLNAEGLPVLAPIRRFTAFEKAALDGCVVQNVKGDRYAKIAWNCYRTAFDQLFKVNKGRNK